MPIPKNIESAMKDKKLILLRDGPVWADEDVEIGDVVYFDPSTNRVTKNVIKGRLLGRLIPGEPFTVTFGS